MCLNSITTCWMWEAQSRSILDLGISAPLPEQRTKGKNGLPRIFEEPEGYSKASITLELTSLLTILYLRSLYSFSGYASLPVH